MPVAVSAGLAYPRWRELSHIVAPLPTDRIVMVDVRNLDPAEETLIRATDITIARIADNYHGDVALDTAVSNLVRPGDRVVHARGDAARVLVGVDRELLDHAGGLGPAEGTAVAAVPGDCLASSATASRIACRSSVIS